VTAVVRSIGTANTELGAAKHAPGDIAYARALGSGLTSRGGSRPRVLVLTLIAPPPIVCRPDAPDHRWILLIRRACRMAVAVDRSQPVHPCRRKTSRRPPPREAKPGPSAQPLTDDAAATFFRAGDRDRRRHPVSGAKHHAAPPAQRRRSASLPDRRPDAAPRVSPCDCLPDSAPGSLLPRRASTARRSPRDWRYTD